MSRFTEQRQVTEMSRYSFVFVLMSLLLVVVFSSSKNEEAKPADYPLSKHLEFSPYTDPGEFAYLYDTLPENLEDLCALIKKQLIHPFDAEKFAGQLPKHRTFEDREYPTVPLMLEELLRRDKRGLTESRKLGDRLVVACVHHSMLLASILRHQGVPVRMRAGFATYIGGRNNLRVTHVVCEVWDRERGIWILVDPDRERVDVPRREFEFAHEVWRRIREGDLGDAQYISRYNSVDQAALHLLFLDLSYVIGAETIYWEDPPVVAKVEESFEELDDDELQVVDSIAILLVEPENHLDELAGIRAENEFLHPVSGR